MVKDQQSALVVIRDGKELLWIDVYLILLVSSGGAHGVIWPGRVTVVPVQDIRPNIHVSEFCQL